MKWETLHILLVCHLSAADAGCHVSEKMLFLQNIYTLIHNLA